MKLNELDSQVNELNLNPLATLRRGGQAIKKMVTRFGSKADDVPTKIDPSLEKPRIKLQPGETLDDAIARITAEKNAAKVVDTPVATPKTTTPGPGTDVKDVKRGFKDRVTDKLSGRELGTPKTTELTPNKDWSQYDVPPKMRKPAPEAPPVKTAEPAPTVKAADEVPAPTVKAADEVPATADKTLAQRGADWAKKEYKYNRETHPWWTRGAIAGTAGTTAAAGDAALTSIANDTEFGTEFKKNFGLGDGEPTDKEGNPGVPASTSSDNPENDPSWIPSANRKQDESLSTLLKLTGQRPITERDSTMGIIKPKAIQTLTESQSIAECGMGMSSSQPASISINATAGSGDEVANMLASIMKLAGVRPVEQDMMPAQNSNMPMMKALQIMGGPDEEMPPSEPDSMNSGVDYPAGAEESDIELDYEPEGPGEDTGTVTVRNVDTGEEHVGRDVTEPGSITVRNVDTGEEFKGKEATDEDQAGNFKANTTPNDPTDVPKFDPNKMADMRNYIDMAQIPPGAPGDNRLPKEEPKLQESSSVDTSVDLFKAYEAFKNGN